MSHTKAVVLALAVAALALFTVVWWVTVGYTMHAWGGRLRAAVFPVTSSTAPLEAKENRIQANGQNAAAMRPSPADRGKVMAEELKGKLKALRGLVDEGLLTEDDFAASKKALLEKL